MSGFEAMLFKFGFLSFSLGLFLFNRTLIPFQLEIKETLQQIFTTDPLSYPPFVNLSSQQYSEKKNRQEKTKEYKEIRPKKNLSVVKQPTIRRILQENKTDFVSFGRENAFGLH